MFTHTLPDGLGLSFKVVLQHLDCLLHGKTLTETNPVATATPHLFANDDRLIAIPGEECDSIEERVGISFANVVMNSRRSENRTALKSVLPAALVYPSVRYTFFSGLYVTDAPESAGRTFSARRVRVVVAIVFLLC